MAVYAIIDGNGNITNMVNWDGVSQWAPPAGLTPVQTDTASVGWTYANGAFVAPPEPVIPAPTIEQQIADLEATMTPRRLREATNGTDNGWMKALDAKIVALRAQIPKT